jgi:hypothetical protein
MRSATGLCSSMVKALHRNRWAAASIPARWPKVAFHLGLKLYINLHLHAKTYLHSEILWLLMISRFSLQM